MTGVTLTEVAAKKRLSPGAACRVVHQVAEAVLAIHAVGLAHGQLCPAAVVVCAPTQVKVLRRPGRSVQPGENHGPVADLMQTLCADFQAPELSAGHTATLALTCDVFALGQILHYLVVGQPARAAAQDLTAVPESLRDIVAAMIAREPQARLSHAGVVAALLADHARVTSSVRADVPASDDSEATFGAYSDYLEQQANVAAMASSATDDVSALSVPPEIDVDAVVDLETEQNSQAEMLRQRLRRERRRHWIWGALLALVFGSVGAVVFRSFREDNIDKSDAAVLEQSRVNSEDDLSQTGLPQTEPAAGQSLARPPVDEEVLGADDGHSLWASPTSGDEIELRHSPPGAQLFLHARPASLLSHAEGPRCLAALGPRFEARRAAWEAAVGLSLAEIDELLLALVPRDVQRPEALWVIRCLAGARLPSRWAAARNVPIDGHDYYVVDGQALWPVPEDYSPDDPPSDGQRLDGLLLVMGTEAAVRAAIETDGTPVLLRRDIERLRAVSDREQHVTFLFAPSFLRAEGDKVLAPQLHGLFSYIADKLGDEARGCLCSFHLDANQFFGELRLVTDNPGGPAGSADLVREQIREIPVAMEAAIAGLASLDPYWRRLALRAVRMAEFLGDHSRVGVERRQVVANFTVPAAAAHNLLLAVELTTAAMGGVPADETASQPPPTTIEEVLATRLSLDIPQQSLEFALQDLEALVNSRLGNSGTRIVIRIDGPSLQADGITRNQEIRGFHHENASVADLLTALVMRANPVTTVTAPDEPDQKLVWVILAEPDPEGGRIILITTRAAVQQKGYSLPGAFQGK